ncbi:mercury transporter [Roseovarius spongiae]|uniref:Mercuric transport protein MerT n=1 Tax=Roseovarius spongiae TaxID=2320272 RepID=A0A3A8B7F7_9RHOB|nr:mercuric transporter MerT family protein [Roseovarius spongiae]RKF12551.1 mercury transporter [Roseovarius spongiae]
MATEVDPAPRRDHDLKAKAAMTGGIFGALAMTSCCILPLVLFSLGATGAWIAQLGALYQYKWFLFAFAGGSLAYGFWKVYRPAPQECDDGSCERPVNQKFIKGALWTATFAVALSLAFPYIASPLLGY